MCLCERKIRKCEKNTLIDWNEAIFCSRKKTTQIIDRENIWNIHDFMTFPDSVSLGLEPISSHLLMSMNFPLADDLASMNECESAGEKERE